jgi:hypothetical protein
VKTEKWVLNGEISGGGKHEDYEKTLRSTHRDFLFRYHGMTLGFLLDRFKSGFIPELIK